MHLVAIRRAVLDRTPGLARDLYDALVASRDAGYRRLDAMASGPSLALMLPFIAAELEATKRVLGTDYWPYGMQANAKTLEALCRYSFEQGLSAKSMAPADLFAPDLLST